MKFALYVCYGTVIGAIIGASTGLVGESIQTSLWAIVGRAFIGSIIGTIFGVIRLFWGLKNEPNLPEGAAVIIYISYAAFGGVIGLFTGVLGGSNIGVISESTLIGAVIGYTFWTMVYLVNR